MPTSLPQGFVLDPQPTPSPMPQITVRYADPPERAGSQGGLPEGFVLDEQQQPNIGQQALGAGTAWLENAVSGIPIAGPILQGAGDYIGTTVQGLATGQDPAQLREDLWARREQRAEDYPLSSISGGLTGAVGSMIPVGATPLGAQALGITGHGLLGRMAASGTSSGIISGLDSAVRHGVEDPGQVAADTMIGAGVGAAIPGVGAGLGVLGRNVIGRASRFAGASADPEAAARRVVVDNLRRDASAGQLLSPADAATARVNNQPLMNMDRGGENIRALMRSAANQSPDARSVVERTTQDRFRDQSGRTVDFFNRIMGGNVDNLARSAEIQSMAREVNSAAYRRAFTAPQAQEVWSADLQGLLQSDAIQRAISQVGVRGSNRSALTGDVPIRNPFAQGPDGQWQIAAQADGSTAVPNLTFWDQVKRNLDSQIGTAQRSGDRELMGDLVALKNRLVSSLDDLVPAYAQARSGAASFFSADNALEAGRNAWSSPRAIDESRAAFGRLSESEQREFGIGLVSQIMDDVRSVNNRSNLMRYFDTPARKEILEMALGPRQAREVEAFIRVEDIMDRARGALGNSTTARQLVELGITGGASGGAAYLGTGDVGTASAVAVLSMAGRRGLQAAGKSVNNRVLQNVAELLSSSDPAVMQQLISRATMSRPHMEALEAVQRGIGLTARGSALSVLQ